MFALGFEFDYESNDSKDVRVAYQPRHVLPPRVEVYSIKYDIWRQVENDVEYYITEHFWSQVCIHIAVHWVAYKPNKKGDNMKPFCNSILRFYLDTEEFDEMGLPEELALVSQVTIFAIMIKRQFCIIHTNAFTKDVREPLPLGCTIWMMMEYDNVKSWTSFLNISLENMGLWSVLDVKKDATKLVCSAESGELVFYGLENQTVTGTGIYGTKQSLYVESLVLLGEGQEVKGIEPELDSEDEDERAENSKNEHKLNGITII